MEPIKRSLGLLVLGLGCMVSAMAQTPTDYQTNPVSKENAPVFLQALKAKLGFPLAWNSGIKDFATWKAAGRAKVQELLWQSGDATPFQAQIIQEIDRGAYIQKRVVFNVTAESRVLGLMLVPKGKGPFPAALMLHDHGSRFDIGKEKLIEPWGDEAKIKSAKEWSTKYFSGRFPGNVLAERGYLVFATDALGWGDRLANGYDGQQALAANLFNVGSSLAGLMAREDSRAADFLATLPEVDKRKIAAVGFSLGAFRAWQVAALSDQISAGVAVCWMGTTPGLMVAGNNQLRGQSAYYTTHPGLVQFLDYPDVASLAAPKPMLFYNGEQDKLFPPDVAKIAYDKMRSVWTAAKATDRLETKIWPLGHVFDQDEQTAAFDWLDKQFGKR